ncbi:MAG: protein-L-isoaspartate(D-aspartate) O-methyltransferase [Chloroflexi bacterium]|nr:protein-L-isoaspartate(D-aspartate) O-methyltransferase [Chloroflexota bacterium]
MSPGSRTGNGAGPGATDGGRDRAEERMLRFIRRHVRDRRVLEAMRAVPRDEFVPPGLRRHAFDDGALPIGSGQTISQPLIVAMMSEAVALDGDERVLEVGTGSGYQGAVLARLAGEVVTVERVGVLLRRARATLRRLGVRNVRCMLAGPDLGAPDDGPFDAIVVTAAAPDVPAALVEQLAEGGRLVIPVGRRTHQELLVVTKRGERLRRRSLGGCRFVPLIGEGGFAEEGGHPS